MAGLINYNYVNQMLRHKSESNFHKLHSLGLAVAATRTITFVLYIISTRAICLFRSCTFFFSLVLPESFWRISKPVSVAIAKYSCV